MAQLQTTTWMDRYRDVFRTVQLHCSTLRKAPSLRILSFGCSHGDELKTLKFYFPDAALFGCDVDSAALENAANIPGCTVFRSTPDALRAFAPFDIIFAMSVLCRFSKSQTASSLTSVFPFSEFEDHVGLLDETLADDGLLCIHNANYFFLSPAFITNMRLFGLL